MYRLFVDTDTCEPTGPFPAMTPTPTPDPMPDTSPTDVQTLYDGAQLFSCNGAFCGGNVPEQFFGSPIPSLTGPNIPRSHGAARPLLRRRRRHRRPHGGRGDDRVAAGPPAGRPEPPRRYWIGPRAAISVAPRAPISSRDSCFRSPGSTSSARSRSPSTDRAASLITPTFQTQTTGLPIGPLTLNGGTIAGSLSDFGLPLTAAGYPPVPGAASTRRAAWQQDGTIPIYRAQIDSGEAGVPALPAG